MTNPTLWRPLLAGEDAAAALQVVEEIAAALKTVAAEAPDAPTERGGRGASLAGGSAGYALFFDYAAEALGRDDYAEIAAQCLDRAIGTVASEPMGYGLYSGFTGIAWVADHLQGRAPLAPEATTEGDVPAETVAAEAAGESDESDDSDDLNAEIDAALLELLERRPWRDTYDLIGGLVGLGVYALERLPRPSAVACLAAVVDQLAESSETAEMTGGEGGGVTWFTPPELLGQWGREATPSGCYNLGVAHGVPAIPPLLAAACRAGVREERARPLLEGAVRWLLAQADRSGELSCYPTALSPGQPPLPSRLAWCYGDAGVATALLVTARIAGRADWEAEAIDIARRAAGRPLDKAGSKDAGLCHGHFGLAHLFNRLHQATGDGLFADTARAWYREGMAFRRPDWGVAGYASWDARDGELSWNPDSGFLTGVAGIGLALLAAATPQEPAWDRVLLVDVPPAPPEAARARAERDS